MELVRSRWGIWAILFLSLTTTAKVRGKRPETILAEVLAKPFVPREFASPECIRDSKYYLEALENYTPWALQMYDASVKIPYGIITGNYKQLGNFDECLLVKNEHFIGQACNAVVQFDIAADNGTRIGITERELDLGDNGTRIGITERELDLGDNGTRIGITERELDLGDNGTRIGITERELDLGDNGTRIGITERELDLGDNGTRIGITERELDLGDNGTRIGITERELDLGDNGTRIGITERELDLGDLFVNVAIASNVTKWTSGQTVEYTGMWCVPSTCNHTEIQDALELAFDSLRVEGRVDMIITVPKDMCHTVESINSTWDYVDYSFILVLAFFAFLCIASTIYDIASQRGIIKSPKDIFTSFSLYKNGKNLLRTDRHRDSIGCLDGMRFISICWIIYGHTYYMEATGLKMNLTQIPRMHHDWSNMLVLNGNIVTDTFFLLSSTLLSYTELLKKERDPKRRFNVIRLYIHRYIRMFSAYAIMIGFYATLLDKLGTGPKWDASVGTNKMYCRENWWTNLLYINNFVNVPRMCMSQSWYLATDMQLVWLSPLVLYPMLKFRSCFFIFISIIYFIFSIIVPFVITYLHGLTGTMIYYKDPEDVAQVFVEIYTKVYNRFGPYIIGLGLGYLLYNTRSYKVKLRVWQVICGWLLAILIGFSAIFGPRGMYFEDHVYNELEASFYAGFHRQVFVLSVSWIIFCCMHGYAGPVNHFLSWRGWIPFSKLTYCAYLSHYIFLLSENGAARTIGNLTQINVLRAFSATLVFTIVWSVALYLCFEMPFMNLYRALSDRKQKSSKHQNSKSTESDNEICQSNNEPSITCDNDNSKKATVHCEPTTIADENRENEEHEEIEKSHHNIYFIHFDSQTERDDARADVNTDKKKSNSVNIEFHRTFDERSRMRPSSSGEELLSINIEPADDTELNQR